MSQRFKKRYRIFHLWIYGKQNTGVANISHNSSGCLLIRISFVHHHTGQGGCSHQSFPGRDGYSDGHEQSMEMQFLSFNPTGMVGTNLKATCLHGACTCPVETQRCFRYPQQSLTTQNMTQVPKWHSPSGNRVFFPSTFSFLHPCLQIHHFCGKAEVVSDLKHSVEPPKEERLSFEMGRGRTRGLQEISENGRKSEGCLAKQN